MRETASKTSWEDDKFEVTLTGTKAEVELLRRMMASVCWLGRSDDGKLESVEKFKPVPSPIEDPQVPPKFGRPVSKFKCPPLGVATPSDIDQATRAAKIADAQTIRAPYNVRCEMADEGWHLPAFTVSAVGAGDGRENAYVESAQRLIHAGFECLRSRRGGNGHYWEVWYLPSTHFARGSLQEALNKKAIKDGGWQAEANAVIDWLISNVAFGSADVVVQRAALTYD